jgi:hypothetical protein
MNLASFFAGTMHCRFRTPRLFAKCLEITPAGTSITQGRLSFHLRAAQAYGLRFTGVVFPDRAVQVELNGRPLGLMAQPDNTTMEFAGDQSALRPGENRIVFFVDKAGPAGSDPRTLGFYLRDIQIEAD